MVLQSSSFGTSNVLISIIFFFILIRTNWKFDGRSLVIVEVGLWNLHIFVAARGLTMCIGVAINIVVDSVVGGSIVFR